MSNGVGHDPPAQSFRAVGVYGRGWLSLFMTIGRCALILRWFSGI